MHLKTILVAYDFSEHAEHALAWARSMAKDWGAKIVLMHAIPPFPPMAYADALTMHAVSMIDLPQLEADLLSDAQQHLQDMLRKEDGDVPVEIKTRIADPFWGICREAESVGADLIVVGSHGRTGLSHVLLGSVAERVVRHARCPVLVVRLPHQVSQ